MPKRDDPTGKDKIKRFSMIRGILYLFIPEFVLADAVTLCNSAYISQAET
jgi:hypothetical protein